MYIIYAKYLWVHWLVDDGLRSGGSHWLCMWRSWQHHGSGEPWVRAMGSFSMVSSVLLQSFLQTGFKTCDEICEYLEKARLHPTGRHWVDNLITRFSSFTSCRIKIGDQVVFDLESIFRRLMLVGQQRDMELLSIFGYDLCAVPPSLVDEYGCLRKGNKAVLMHRLGLKQCQLQRPDVLT